MAVKNKNNNEELELLDAEIEKPNNPVDWNVKIRKARKLLRLIDAGLALFNGR